MSSAEAGNPIDQVLDDRSKAVRVDYPNDRVEYMWVDEHGVLVGSMNGNGPFPLDPRDARTVCNNYDAELIDREDVRGEAA